MGKRMMRWAIDYAKKEKQKCSMVALSSLPTSVIFYKALGFKAVDVKAVDAENDEDMIEGQVYMEYRLRGKRR